MQTPMREEGDDVAFWYGEDRTRSPRSCSQVGVGVEMGPAGRGASVAPLRSQSGQSPAQRLGPGQSLPLWLQSPCWSPVPGILQCSCLENPKGSRGWWAVVSGVAQSQTRLKRLSSSSISNLPWHSHLEDSLTISYLILCNPMNCSTPGLPDHHQLPEFTQTHVHRVGDAFQPSPLP